MGCGIQYDFAMTDLRRGASNIAPQQGADACGQLIQVEGLDQVIIRAAVQSLYPISHGIAGSEDEHRHRVAGLAQLFEQIKPSQLR